MSIERRYTKRGQDPLTGMKFERRRSVITNPDGSIVFKMDDVEVPASWSQLATDILVSKYFRKAEVPGTGHEVSARQVVERIVKAVRLYGEKLGGYFATPDDAQAFEDELVYMLMNQIGAFNSPVWFNCGLKEAYGIAGKPVGSWAWDPEVDQVREAPDAYGNPQVSACFIQSVKDDLMDIAEGIQREMRLFKFGSGCTSGDSRVFVSGEGFIPIRRLYARFRDAGRTVRDFDGQGRFIDIADADLYTLSVDEETGVYSQQRIEKVWEYDVAKDAKLTVRFDRGAKATVSAWHPFLVWDGQQVVERRADQLQRGDAVLGPNETAVTSVIPRETTITYETTYFHQPERHSVVIDADMAWLCGYFMGDGSLGATRKKVTNAQGRQYVYDGLRLRFHDETTEVLERVQELMRARFDEQASIQEDGRGSNGKHLAYTGRRSTGFFAEVFDVGPKTHDLRMPAFVWEGGRELGLAFLAGLVDSDGWVAEGRASYATASREFAKDVAVLASFLGLGGGVTDDTDTAKVSVVHRSAGAEVREALAAHLHHPTRRARLLDYAVEHERKYCMPLARDVAVELFGDRAPAEWLRVPVGGETVHLGRLQYEGIVNPTKLRRALAAKGGESALAERLDLIAESVAFVTEVAPCTEDPDFYDLTVEEHANYLAGENGLVAIHNTGGNFSKIRAEGEQLTSGGTSSGLMSFLEIYDKSAGAIKSGGTTRRAAKMVCLDMDHPDIVRFIEWKSREEDKVRALIKAGYSSDFNGEAYRTVSGQNSNNSVRVTDEFMKAVVEDREWYTTWRTNGKPARRYRARELMRKVAEASWRCADPGMQYDTTCNAWHTVPNTGRINASNPCSEYLHLDDTACNLASLNLTKFLREDNRFDVEGYRHACRAFIIAQEILVDYASYPTQLIAQNSHDYRPLGLGYANLGSLLLATGQPYDSPQARATCGAITAIMNGAAYEASAEIAASKGPFPGFAHNREPMLKVMNMHREAAYRLDAAVAEPSLLDGARTAWDRAVAAGMRHGYRNAQATVLAPTGTIGLLMDCDTTGIEPDFALVKFKKLAGGGSFKIVNTTVSRGLRNLGYTAREIEDIVAYMRGTWSLEGTPHINRQSLAAKGLQPEELDRVEQALPGAFELRHAFTRHVLGDGAFKRLGFADRLDDPSFELLKALGFTDAQVEEASEVTSGRLTIEGAPHLKPEHLPVFDCANRCGKRGTRSIEAMGHVRMMAAAQPFLSGAISKTVNLPTETSVEDIENVYIEGWKLGLKAIAVYRDGSKASQVLSASGADKKDKAEKAENAEKPATAPAPVATAAAVPVVAPAPAGHAAPVAQAAPVGQAASMPRLERRRLPKKRTGFTQEARVGGQKIYLRTGEYEDGSLGEVFIDLAKEGAALRSLMNCFAISVSLGLQHGVPLEEFVNAFTFTRFEPQGRVLDHPNIKFATSAVDYVFRVLGMEYLGRTDFVHVKPSDSDLDDEKEVAGSGDDDAEATAPSAAAAPVAPAPTAAPTPAPAGEGASAPATGKPGTGRIKAKNRLEGLSALTQNLMGDAPFCGGCGHITVRNGSCYRCLNCGNSMGCS